MLPVKREDWSESWKKHFHPIEISDRLLLKPDWEQLDAKPGQAVVTLKQGAGRLIRDVSDRGLLMLGDNRVQKMRYGRNFLDSLPPMTRIQDEAAATEFLSGLAA